MMSRYLGALAICALIAGTALSAGAAMPSQGFPVITGEHWVNATPEERLAFIAGLTTMIELEKEVQGDMPQPPQKSLIPSWVKGLSQLTLKDIVAALDGVFAKKPELKAKPVVEVLWYEVAFPDSRK